MAKAAAAPLPVVEELHFKSESAYLCLLVNRRIGLIRVIDFRSGALPAKRLFIQNVAKREGIEKVILLVEKDEVSSWTRVGFVREAKTKVAVSCTPLGDRLIMTPTWSASFAQLRARPVASMFTGFARTSKPFSS